MTELKNEQCVSNLSFSCFRFPQQLDKPNQTAQTDDYAKRDIKNLKIVHGGGYNNSNRHQYRKYESPSQISCNHSFFPLFQSLTLSFKFFLDIPHYQVYSVY